MRLFTVGMLAMTLSVLLIVAMLHGFDQQSIMRCLAAER
jgi:hypothetical protein